MRTDEMDQSIPVSIFLSSVQLQRQCWLNLLARNKGCQPNEVVQLTRDARAKMRNSDTATKSMMTSVNSRHGSTAIDNGDGRM
jgi:hypothetical protein